jgi:hypothetical protein
LCPRGIFLFSTNVQVFGLCRESYSIVQRFLSMLQFTVLVCQASTS